MCDRGRTIARRGWVGDHVTHRRRVARRPFAGASPCFAVGPRCRAARLLQFATGTGTLRHLGNNGHTAGTNRSFSNPEVKQ